MPSFTPEPRLGELCLIREFSDLRLVLLRRVCGLLFFLHYLQAFDLLEGEAHYAALLALVLKVDGLVVVVDHDLRRHPAAVVEPLCPLGDVFVLYLLGVAFRIIALLQTFVCRRRASTIAHIHPSVLQAVSGRGYAGRLKWVISGGWGGDMQDLGYELRRIPIPRTRVNKGKKGPRRSRPRSFAPRAPAVAFSRLGPGLADRRS